MSHFICRHTTDDIESNKSTAAERQTDRRTDRPRYSVCGNELHLAGAAILLKNKNIVKCQRNFARTTHSATANLTGSPSFAFFENATWPTLLS